MASITNLVPNPRVANALTGWGAYGASVTVVRDTTETILGDTSIKVDTNSSGTQGVAWDSLDIPTTPGQGITVVVSARGTVFIRFGVLVRSDAGASLETRVGAPVLLTAGGDQLRSEITIGHADAAWLRPVMYVAASSTTSFWCANWMVVNGAYDGPYFDGDSPNAVWTGTPHASTSVLTIPEEPIYSDPIIVTANDPLTAITAGDPLVPIG